ncbi:MAG: hypothetical protein Q8O84_04470 [Nanoarchaeota archaeon]|nr:hypothetical protein [Nanoarchaeota archaeon]
MTEKKLLIAKKNDINLENLAGKEVGKFYLNGSTSRSRIIFSSLLGKSTLKERLYLAVCAKAEKEKANLAVIEKEGINSVKGTFYSTSENVFSSQKIINGRAHLYDPGKGYVLLNKY